MTQNDTYKAIGINIEWQTGTVTEAGTNGAQVEDVIAAALDRLRDLNSHFPCRENSLAITDLESARNWLYQRTRDRQARGVEGQHVA